MRLRYYLRVTLSRGLGGASEDFPLWVRNVTPPDKIPREEVIKARAGSLQNSSEMLAARCLWRCIGAELDPGRGRSGKGKG